MDGSKIEAYLPAIPRGIFIEKQINSALVGKKITQTSWERYYTGQYSWQGEIINGFDKLSDQTIIFADASYILTDKGALISFGCFDNGLRYYARGETINPPKTTKSQGHGYHAKLFFDDGACFCMNLYGWGTFFKLYAVDTKLIYPNGTSKHERYPFLPKAPIDVTDDEDFTYNKFTDWLSKNPGANIIENCSTAKGAFKIDNPVMNYILLTSKIHPRTKTREITNAETGVLFDNTKKLINEYKNEIRICEHTDIYGKTIAPHNEVLRMTSSALGLPCPVCGTPIEATPITAGTKMYFCPACQIIKK